MEFYTKIIIAMVLLIDILIFYFCPTMSTNGSHAVSIHELLVSWAAGINWTSPKVLFKISVGVFLILCLLRAVLFCWEAATKVATLLSSPPAGNDEGSLAPSLVSPGPWPEADGESDGGAAASPPPPPPLPPSPTPSPSPMPRRVKLYHRSDLASALRCLRRTQPFPWERAKLQQLARPKRILTEADLARCRHDREQRALERAKRAAKLAEEEREREAKREAARLAEEERERAAVEEAQRKKEERAAAAATAAARAFAAAAALAAAEEAEREKEKRAAMAAAMAAAAAAVAAAQHEEEQRVAEEKARQEEARRMRKAAIQATVKETSRQSPSLAGDNIPSSGEDADLCSSAQEAAEEVSADLDVPMPDAEPAGIAQPAEPALGQADIDQEMEDAWPVVAVHSESLESPAYDELDFLPDAPPVDKDSDGDTIMTDAAPVKRTPRGPPPSAPKGPRCAPPTGSHRPSGMPGGIVWSGGPSSGGSRGDDPNLGRCPEGKRQRRQRY